MEYKLNKVVIIALGGSIIYPDKIDYFYLKKFKQLLAPFLKRKIKFVLVIGGGKLAREYQNTAGKIAVLKDADKDWLGVRATRLNAELLRLVFNNNADPVIIDARYKIKKLKYPITIASGWKPGWSTDYVAIALAQDFNAKEVIIAGKPSYVYDKDHARYKNAVPYFNLSWKDYGKLAPKKWSPGTHAPVDPVAARLARKEKINAIIVNGKNLKNFNDLLSGKNFQGTIIL